MSIRKTGSLTVRRAFLLGKRRWHGSHCGCLDDHWTCSSRASGVVKYLSHSAQYVCSGKRYPGIVQRKNWVINVKLGYGQKIGVDGHLEDRLQDRLGVIGLKEGFTYMSG